MSLFRHGDQIRAASIGGDGNQSRGLRAPSATEWVTMTCWQPKMCPSEAEDCHRASDSALTADPGPPPRTRELRSQGLCHAVDGQESREPRPRRLRRRRRPDDHALSGNCGEHPPFFSDPRGGTTEVADHMMVFVAAYAAFRPIVADVLTRRAGLNAIRFTDGASNNGGYPMCLSVGSAFKFKCLCCGSRQRPPGSTATIGRRVEEVGFWHDRDGQGGAKLVC